MVSDLCGQDLVTVEDLTVELVTELLDAAEDMLQEDKRGDRYSHRLNNKTLAFLSYEPSTRTRESTEMAMRQLGGKATGFSGQEGTSVMKKEALWATVKMYESYGADIIALRHPSEGSAQWAADVSARPVINAGDGSNQHPTQALLDAFVIRHLRGGSLDNLHIGFGGDAAYGRTIHSDCMLLSLFQNLHVHSAVPEVFDFPGHLVSTLKKRGAAFTPHESIDAMLPHVEFIYHTRPQTERTDLPFEEVVAIMQGQRITRETLQNFSGRLLHPMPINSAIAEISYDALFHPSQGLLAQAQAGVFLRKALLWKTLGEEQEYKPFQAHLHPELQYGDYFVKVTGKGTSDKEGDVRDIYDGTVIDHIAKNCDEEVLKSLRLREGGYTRILADIDKKSTTIVKTNKPSLTTRELKVIMRRSPEPTINYIRNCSIEEKFIPILCDNVGLDENSGCISRLLNEDVPPKFWNNDGVVSCRYCRHVYEFKSSKISPDEKRAFIENLPTRVEPIRYGT